MEINDIILVLNDYPSFIFLILLGLSFIIVGVASSIIIRMFRIPVRTLTRNQSIILVVIGCILILGEMAILASFTNVYPTIDIQIDPASPIMVSAKGTPVNITVNAYYPGNNKIQKIFNRKTSDFLYQFYLLNPYGSLFKIGPTPKNHSTFVFFPEDAGVYTIVIDVGYYAASGFVKVSSTSTEYIISLPQNKPPTIVSINSSKFASPVGRTILISVEAKDPEGDQLYYNFTRIGSESIYEIPPLEDYKERERFWIPNASDIGDNIIRVHVRDGSERGPYSDRNPVQKDLILNIYDPHKPS